MKHLLYIFIVYIAILCQPVQAQFNDWGFKLGLRGGFLFPENEFANLGITGNDNFSFDWYKTSYLIEAFAGYELSDIFELQLSAGYGIYTGKAVFAEGTNYGEYKSKLIPVELIVRFTPFEMSAWNPYIYAGGGIMRFERENSPNLISPAVVKPDGWVASIPAGVGAEFLITDNIALDLTFGGTFGTTWDLDGYSSLNSKVWDSYLNTTAGITFILDNCSADADMDNLGKCDEELIGTNAKNPDTDNDGLLDGEEYLNYKTNPLLADTDNDGLTDGKEININTNPLLTDSDGDGLSDGEEVIKYKTFPLVADSDYDDLNDGYEINTITTNPLLKDSDNDRLNDGEEVNKYLTSPLLGDTDKDDLSDSEEVLKYKTDPLSKDTDGGTISDFVEVVRGSNPLDKSDDIVIEVGTAIVLEGITFSTGQADITPESELVLLKALYTLQGNPEIVVEIGGHTDDVGNAKSNQKLSRLRADAVRNWFITKGISGARITAAGYGEDKPRVQNDTPENQRLNRRIEFKRIK